MAIRLGIQKTGPDKSIEELLDTYGRIGGPTQFGWHTHEAKFRCWREHHLRQSAQDNTANNRSFALAVGSLVHELLAAYYLNHANRAPSAPKPDKPFAHAADGTNALYTFMCANGYSDEANEALRLYRAYRTKYDANDSYLAADVGIIAIEHHVQRDLPCGIPYTARADMVLKLPDGYWIVDHKTTAAKTSEFVEGWQVDPGILGLLWACAAEYDPICGVSINGIVKTKEPDFDRFMYARDDRMIAGWLAMMQYKLDEETQAMDDGWPQNFTACFRKMGPRVGKCRFWSQCVYGE